MIYMTQGTKVILGSMSSPFVVRRYVRGEEEVTSSASKTLLRLKFNPGVSVLRAKISPFDGLQRCYPEPNRQRLRVGKCKCLYAGFTLGGGGFLHTRNNQFCLYWRQRARYWFQL